MSAKRARLARSEYAACSADWDLCDIFMDPCHAPAWLTAWRAAHAVPRDRAARYRCFARFMRRDSIQRSRNWSRFAPVVLEAW